MLVLSRSVGEQLLIGDNKEITLTVLEMTSRSVRLAVEAPHGTPVQRGEVVEQMREEREQS
jgi:carbon storage regulator CsrA